MSTLEFSDTQSQTTAGSLAGLACAFAAVLLLVPMAGCGGSGGGAASPAAPTPPSPSPSPPPPPPPPPPASDFQDARTSATGNYSNAKTLAVFNLINAQRLAAGLGVLTQATALDTAATAQSNYLGLNNDLQPTTTQEAGRRAFTAVTTAARVLAAGYTGSAAENAVGAIRLGPDGVQALLSSPYQRLRLMNHGTLDLGLGFVEPGTWTPAGATPVFPESQSSVLYTSLVTTAATLTGQLPQNMLTASAGVSVYPANNAVEVPVMMYRELPNPVAAEVGPWGRGTFPGYTVSLQSLSTQSLVVSLFTLTRVTAAGRVAVATKLLDQNDPTFFRPNNIRNWASLVPLAVLVPGATYEATFAGTAGSTAVARVWQFNTRAGFNAGTPTRDATTAVTVPFTTPSGVIDVVGSAPIGCGSAYNPEVKVGLQSIRLEETGIRPLAGCAVDLNVFDLGTQTSAIRRIVVP